MFYFETFPMVIRKSLQKVYQRVLDFGQQIAAWVSNPKSRHEVLVRLPIETDVEELAKTLCVELR